MRSVRTSAKAVIIRDNKLLAVKLKDSDGEFYILPGGGQEAGEPLPDAVKREVAEEMGVDVCVEELLFVIEGPKGEDHHRVDLVFECEYIGKLPNAELHGDTNQIGFDWLDIETLNRTPLYPSKLRRPIMEHCAGRPHAVYLGCESVGDPECVD